MNNRPPGCKAYVLGSQWFCDECGTTWDLDDDAPQCGPVPVVPVHRNIGNRALNDIKDILK